jgi:hypothetical protein
MGGSPPSPTADPLRRLALLLLPLLAACDEPAPLALSPAEAAERDSVLAVLRAADTDALAAAFDRLDALPYTVEITTAQLGPDGGVTARRHSVVEVDPAAAPNVLRTDSAGAFDWGAFGPLVSADPEAALPADNPAALALSEDPPYLAPRGREAFAFRFAPDTLVGGARVRVLAVEARPGEGDDQLLRYARLYVDDGGALVGVRLRRQTESVLFSEASDATILLRPTPAGTWLPHVTRFDASVSALFTDRRRFRLQRVYAPGVPALSAETTSAGV